MLEAKRELSKSKDHVSTPGKNRKYGTNKLSAVRQTPKTPQSAGLIEGHKKVKGNSHRKLPGITTNQPTIQSYIDNKRWSFTSLYRSVTVDDLSDCSFDSASVSAQLESDGDIESVNSNYDYVDYGQCQQDALNSCANNDVTCESIKVGEVQKQVGNKLSNVTLFQGAECTITDSIETTTLKKRSKNQGA